MLQVYTKLARILDHRDKQLAVYVLLLALMVSIIEVLGVASIMPFMAVLTNPGVIQTNAILAYTFDVLEFDTTDNFVFFLGVSVFIFLVGSAFLRALVVWSQVYYANIRHLSISSRVVSGYLQQPYYWFLTKNSSNLAAAVLEEVSRVVNGCLYPFMRLITNGIVATLLLSLLVYADPLLALGSFLVLGFSYGIIILHAGEHLSTQGHIISASQTGRLKALNEAFGGIKDVKSGGYENYFIDKYRKHARRHALSSVSAKLWGEMPSFAMQALVFGGMMIMILYLMKTRDSFDNAIPVLSLFALGAYKLMPALQEIYKQIVEIKYNQPALDVIYKDIELLKPSSELFSKYSDNALELNDQIELRDVKYSYPESEKIALDIRSLKIQKNSTVGFVGGSGAGKTTTVDLILGLLEASSGGLYVDDILIDQNNIRPWQMNLGYVSQQIYLSDDSIAANIAFGVPQVDIDYAAVTNAAKIAHLHEFITSELENGYHTEVGERGVRLSGGQRQRIGIARALYHNPDVLILDEATSALDYLTEKIIMDAVEELSHKKTIIIIAHRLSTIRNCDKLFLLNNGEVVATGSYDQLMSENADFKKMANAQMA